MRRVVLASIVFVFLCVLSSKAHAQACTDSVNANSKMSTMTTAMMLPPGGGCGGGGGHYGGGGGGGTPSSCSAVSGWSSFTSPSQSGPQYRAGGTSGRQGVGSVVVTDPNTHQGTLYVVDTSANGSYNGVMQLFTNNTGVGYGLTSLGYVYDIYGNPLYAASNPALTTDGTYLYLAWIDSAGVMNWAQSTPVANGAIHFQNMTSFNTGGNPFIYSPSLTTFVNSGNQTMIVMSAMTSDRILWIGQFPAGSPGLGSLTGYSQFGNIGMSPGLGTFNNTIYVGYPTNDNSHNLYYLTSTDGYNFSFSSSAAGDQSSTTPALQSYNGCLYMAFRTNDGDHKFIYKYSSNGSSWSGSTSLSGVTMGGPPSLADGTTLQSDPNHLVVTFVANDSSYYLYEGEGH